VNIILQLDDLNPQIAARMANPLISWKRYEKTRQDLMVGSLERLREKRDLSRDVYEIVNRGLIKS
ncbi:MAG: aminopeptidase N C-terminal domain-containing protein, partial [Desulfofustis sp.]|nr:aminopeptidase N C-terminal domain-containing protein [Desulfofustis sp.]